MKRASNSDWTFIAMSHKNTTTSAADLKETSVYTNLGQNREVLDTWKSCLYDQDHLFTAIEMNYPMLISPIMLVAESLPPARAQAEYLEHVEEMSIRTGPTVENSLRVKIKC